MFLGGRRSAVSCASRRDGSISVVVASEKGWLGQGGRRSLVHRGMIRQRMSGGRQIVDVMRGGTGLEEAEPVTSGAWRGCHDSCRLLWVRLS